MARMVTCVKSTAVSACLVLFDVRHEEELPQCLGIAKALGIDATSYAVSAKTEVLRLLPRVLLPNGLLFFRSRSGRDEDPACIEASIIIAAGKLGCCAALNMKARTKAKVIAIGKLGTSRKVDAVVAPSYMRYGGGRVISTLGPLNALSCGTLKQVAKTWKDRLDAFARPFTCILVGKGVHNGSAERFINDLLALKGRIGGTFLVFVAAGKDVLSLFKKKLPKDYVWDGNGDSPYEAFLGSADFIIVTQDALMMISEAAVMSSPLYLYPVCGCCKHHQRFYEDLYRKGIARPFLGIVCFWRKEGLDQKPYVSRRLQQLFAEKTSL